MTKAIQILKPAEVCKEFGIGSTLLYEKLNPKSRYYDAAFPVPVALGGRSVGFYRHELEAWAESRPRVTPEERQKRVSVPCKAKRAGRKAA
jgi:prophage regulatory protein